MEAEASSRDLLQRFAGSTTISDNMAAADSGDEIELRLSLGGGFSSNPREKTTNMLVRSSSISSFPFSESKVESTVHLQRTCSLPVPGTDEDYRKRKEMQSLKRMEAKRKRYEKRNGLKGEEHGQHPESRRGLPPLSQGSIGSVGSSSTGGGAMQGLGIVRFSKFSDAKSSSTSNPDQTTNRNTGEDEHTTKTPMERRGSGIEEMPFVSTRGTGPQGKRIEGFLYKYRKGEDVRIVCVCHGKFLTPAEFVKHAGGGDVDHPLKHIVVSPSPSSC